MAGTNLFSPISATCDVALTTPSSESGADQQLAMFAKCTGTPPTTANTFEHGCLMNRTDSGAGINALYENTGTAASPVWTLLDTALGGPATSLVDSNGVTAVDVGTTASAVNNLRVTDSATGAVSANAVLISAVGSDAAVSLAMAPKGATGITTIGLATGTGDIVLGSSSASQTVKIANGAGAGTVQINDVSTVGSTTTIAGAATASGADTVNIATGATTAAGGKVVHIADGTPTGSGTNLVTIGSNANTASTTTIQGGSGAGAIALTPQTTGVVTVGASGGTGDVVVGKSSGTQSVKIGDGAGVSTVNIANTSVAGANMNVASAATGSGVTDTVTISGGNAAATGVKVVNILTGTPTTSGNNRLTMGGGTTSKVTTNATVTSYQAINYIATESGSNNAIVATLTDASGNNVTVAAGLRVVVQLAHTLQAGANTFNLNGHGTDSIKLSTNAASDLTTAYASTGVIDLFFNGTVWLAMGGQ